MIRDLKAALSFIFYSIMITVFVFLAGMGFSQAADYGSDAYTYMKYLNDNYPDRVQNTTQVHQAGEWIQNTLASFGYTVETYSYDAFGMRIVDYVATKRGNTDKTVYVGSHYDCVAGETRGADDNGSGVGVNLELAKRFVNKSTDCTIKFCFWDAEELDYGMAGSYMFTERNMSQSDWNNALLCINLDCVGAGDELYVYGGEYVNGKLTKDWGLNMADSIAAELGITLKHMPSCITSYQTPTRVASSDHYYFATRGGVPYIYFEATAWTRADGSINQTNQGWVNSKLDGFANTNGQIMHTKNDNLSVFEKVVPGRVKTHLSQVSQMTTSILQRINASSPNTYQSNSPSISKVSVSNVTSNGYKVTAKFSAPAGVSQVYMPTWTDKNGQDDIVWHKASVSGNTATYTVSIKNHKNESGLYRTHVYVYDTQGRYACYPVDVTVPKGSNYTYNGMDYSPVFDASYYLKKYKDLKAAFGTNKTAAFEHFIQYGMKEARQASANFNVEVYKKKYADLRKAFGNDTAAYYRHYIQYGKTEGRTAK